MPIRVALHHKTTYRYDRRVKLSPQTIRLRPAPHCRTPVTAYSLRIDPLPHFINWQQDPQSNYLARVVFPEPVRHFQVEVDLVAEMTVINPLDFFLEPYAETFPFVYEESLARELAPYLAPAPAGPRLRGFLETIDRTPRALIGFLADLNIQLQRQIRYTIRMEPGVQTPEETLMFESGSCRDTAWLLVQIFRNLGLAARFVSGYLIQLKADVKSLDGPSGAEQDFTDLHAWTEVYLPGAGWVGLDPTSGLFAGEGHLPLAATPQFTSASPVTGSVDPCEVEFEHEMTVTRVHEEPRVTLPYTDAQWKRIEALGQQVDAEIRANDIRLTMGGEPTFVSIDDMDGAEWNTDAMGPHKRALAEDLIERMRHVYAPGALLHCGQGKWYPGEPLPRWALGCYWRRDGVPLWRDAKLLARAGQDHHYGPADAERFAQTLARRLGVDPDYVNAAFEDSFYYLHRERQLPVNVDPKDSHLDDAQERERLRGIFERGLDTPAGYVLPSAARRGARRVRNGRPACGCCAGAPVPDAWRFADRTAAAAAEPSMGGSGRRCRKFAKPIRWRRGVRCPCRGDTLAEDPALQREHDKARNRKPEPGESAAWVVRKALCVEPRAGTLHVFMPPVDAEDYIDLLAAVEDTAAHLGMPVVIEGYTPPCDPRIERDQGDARSRRDRSQHPSRAQLGGTGGAHHHAFTNRRGWPAGHRKVHAGWTAQRHRRRQPFRAGRGHSGGQPVPAPARPAAQHARLLAEPSVAVLSVFGLVHRSHQPGAARG